MRLKTNILNKETVLYIFVLNICFFCYYLSLDLFTIYIKFSFIKLNFIVVISILCISYINLFYQICTKKVVNEFFYLIFWLFYFFCFICLIYSLLQAYLPIIKASDYLLDLKFFKIKIEYTSYFKRIFIKAYFNTIIEQQKVPLILQYFFEKNNIKILQSIINIDTLELCDIKKHIYYIIIVFTTIYDNKELLFNYVDFLSLIEEEQKSLQRILQIRAFMDKFIYIINSFVWVSFFNKYLEQYLLDGLDKLCLDNYSFLDLIYYIIEFFKKK